MLGRKGRDSGKAAPEGRIAYRISNREDAGIEYTDDVAGVSFLNDRAILGH